MSPEQLRRIEELRRRQLEQMRRSRDQRQRPQKAIFPGTPEYAAQQQKIANMPQELKDLQTSFQQKQIDFQKRRMQDPEFIAYVNKQKEFVQRLQSNPEYQELQRAAFNAQRQGRPFVPNDAQKRTQQKLKMEQDLFQRQMQQDPYVSKMRAEDAAFRKATQQERETLNRRMQEYVTPTPPRDEQLRQRQADRLLDQRDFLKKIAPRDPTKPISVPATPMPPPTRVSPPKQITSSPPTKIDRRRRKTHGDPMRKRRDPRPNMVTQMPATLGPSAPVQAVPKKPTVESQMKDLMSTYGKPDPQNEPAWAKAAREKAKTMQFTRGRMGPP